MRIFRTSVRKYNFPKEQCDFVIEMEQGRSLI